MVRNGYRYKELMDEMTLEEMTLLAQGLVPDEKPDTQTKPKKGKTIKTPQDLMAAFGGKVRMR